MTFEQPIPFDEAISSNRIKSLLPTSLSSADLRSLDSAIKRRSMFSAKVSNAGFLQSTQDLLNDLLEQKRFASIPESRVALRSYLDSIGYQAARRGIEDLRSQPRLDLLLRTNMDTAYGFGNFLQGQDETILDAWPAQELFRAEDRKEPRDWYARWDDAGGNFYGGRMIALKDDDIWQALGDGAGGYDDTLGNPYPPFAFNSGMDVQDVSRMEAMALGLIDADTEVDPQDLDFNAALKAGVDTLSGPLTEALLDSLGGGFRLTKGILELVDE